MDGKYERGEIYWVRLTAGSEISNVRPACIVSCNKLNDSSPCVMVSYLSTKEHPSPGHVFTVATGRDSWIETEQTYCVDKQRITKYMGVLCYSEMKELDRALENTFDLGYEDEAVTREKNRLKAEIEKLQKQVNEVEELHKQIEQERADHQTELELWKRLYDSALNKFVDLKLNRDAEQWEVHPKKDKNLNFSSKNSPIVLEKKEENAKIDINTCTQTQLKKCGLNPAAAKIIIDKRPYSSLEEIKNISGLKKSMYRLLEDRICCVPVVVKEESNGKVNINTCVAKDLWDGLSMKKWCAYAITSYRNRNGAFESVSDLLKIKDFPDSYYEEYKEYLEV